VAKHHGLVTPGHPRAAQFGSMGEGSWIAFPPGDYVNAHAGNARHLLHLPLSRLEARLDPLRFVRVHRAHIVNLDHVRAFRRGPGGNLEAELLDGARVPVSRRAARELRSLGR